MTVLGYIPCKTCGSPVLDVVAYKTGNLCPKHHREVVAARIETFELRGKGLRVPLPVDKPKTEWEKTASARRNKQRRENPARRRHEHLRLRAQLRTYRRMRSLFPDVYDLLMAEERAKVGLDPWPLEAVLTAETAEATLAFIESYHRRDGPDSRGGARADDPDEAPPGQ